MYWKKKKKNIWQADQNVASKREYGGPSKSFWGTKTSKRLNLNWSRLGAGTNRCSGRKRSCSSHSTWSVKFQKPCLEGQGNRFAKKGSRKFQLQFLHVAFVVLSNHIQSREFSWKWMAWPRKERMTILRIPNRRWIPLPRWFQGLYFRFLVRMCSSVWPMYLLGSFTNDDNETHIFIWIWSEFIPSHWPINHS